MKNIVACKCTCSCVFVRVKGFQVDVGLGALEERALFLFVLFCILKTGSLIEPGCHFS